MRRTNAWTAAALLIMMGHGAGCDTVKDGEEGRLAFQLATDDRLFPVSFGTPIATGLSVQVNVYDANANDGQRVEANVVSAVTTPTDVATVTKSGSRLVLTGVSAGTAELQVDSDLGSDRIDVSVMDIETVDLSNPGLFLAPESPPIRIVEGGTARFMSTLKGANDRTLVGYGAVPVTVSPASAGEVLDTNDVAHVSVTFSEIGDATVTGEGDEGLPVTVVAREAVTELVITGLSGLSLGDTSAFALRGRDADANTIVGLSGLATVTSETPDVCSLTEAPKLGDGTYTVEALKSGECTIKAVLAAVETSETYTVTTE